MNKIMFLKAYGKRILAQDSFDRANGALGTAEMGGAWIIERGTCAIASNKAKGTTADLTNRASLQIGVSNHVVSADVTWFTGETVGIGARLVDGTNTMSASYNGTALTISKSINSAGTTLATLNYSWTSGTTKRIGFAAFGNEFFVYVDGVMVLSAVDDNVLKTATKVGFSVYKVTTPSTTFDNFLAMG